MKRTKALAAALLAALFVIAALPIAAFRAGDQRSINTGVTVDTDPAGGYTGDYVVIYNPGSVSVGESTGSLAGRIVTDLTANTLPARAALNVNEDIPYVIDVDAEVARYVPEEPAPEFVGERDAYVIGSTRSFGLYNYPPVSGYDTDFTFKVIAVGQHCRVWTPVDEAYHPLDAINPSYAQTAADRFDEKFELMQVSYGDFKDVVGDGKVELLFYDIGDGWQPGQGYVAGYFWQEDYRYNNCAMLHVDTYPGIAYTNAAGNYIEHFDDCFGTIVHEFQHCINYSQNEDGMAVWLNEALSGSAEELCFPGSGLSERIFSWNNQKLNSLAEIQNPPVEYEYDPGFDLHKGGSITAWDSSQRDIYARYAEVMFFSQYLYTRYGSTAVYKRIIDSCTGETVQDSIDTLVAATGWSQESLWQDFFTRMVANDPGSGMGFNMNAGYDPDEYWGLSSLYSILSPVVYTSTEAAEIYGGGFITVKPAGGSFVPPADASSALRYVGITIGEVGLEGIELTPAETSMYLNETARLVVARTPVDANNYEMSWASSDESVVTVAGNRFAATVTSHAPGSASITATATDKETGFVYTASAVVTVEDGQTYTKYVPVNTVETGREYMIGAEYNGRVYVLMNYNPDPEETGYYGDYNYCQHYQSTEYAYGIKAQLNDQGEIIGVDNSRYPNATDKMAEWLFYDADDGYYYIRSNYNRSYHLRVTNWENYYGLYPQDGQSYAYKWTWDAENSRLYYYFSSKAKKHITFMPSIGSLTEMFYAPNTASSVQLYRKETGIIMNEDTFTVTFRDWDGTVLKTQQVEAGAAAAAPADPVREGFTFTGWDADFSCVTSNLTVTAQYSVNSYDLTVIYEYEDHTSAAPAFTGSYVYNTAYFVESPVIEGYTASAEAVIGTMPAHDVTITVTYTANAQPGGLLGDVDCSGTVDMSDVSMLFSYLNGSGAPTAQGLANADANSDGSVNVMDITAIFGIIANS